MSLSSSDPLVLDKACMQQPNYYIDDDPKSIGASCYTAYQAKATTEQNESIGIYCDKLNSIMQNNVNFNNCLFNWKESPQKKNWMTNSCQRSAIQLVPPIIRPNLYEYNSATAVPGIFCSHCKLGLPSVFKNLTEQQKLLIDLWVAKHINDTFITPEIMEQIQMFKTLRINEMYSNFTEQKLMINANQLNNAASDTWDSFVSILPYILIIIACIIAAVIMGKFYSNLSKITELGKEQVQSAEQQS